MLQITQELKAAYPGGWIGGVFFKNAKVNKTGEMSLRKMKGDLEDRLQYKYRDFNRSDFVLLEPIKSYIAYYKRFKKTYHVLLQLESVILKGKFIPNINPLVTIMFMAELRNFLLTAGHNLDSIALPVRADLSKGNERYRLLNGMEKKLPAGDMMMADREGIISSIIYGPDDRTQITEDTNNVFYTVYVPPGIEGKSIREHFNDINRYMHLVAPEAQMEEMAVYPL